jgi:hypothetical protein
MQLKNGLKTEFPSNKHIISEQSTVHKSINHNFDDETEKRPTGTQLNTYTYTHTMCATVNRIIIQNVITLVEKDTIVELFMLRETFGLWTKITSQLSCVVMDVFFP